MSRPEKQKGGLRLDQKDAALKGGDAGPLLVRAKARRGLLIQVVAGTKEDIARLPKNATRFPTSRLDIKSVDRSGS